MSRHPRGWSFISFRQNKEVIARWIFGRPPRFILSKTFNFLSFNRIRLIVEVIIELKVWPLQRRKHSIDIKACLWSSYLSKRAKIVHPPRFESLCTCLQKRSQIQTNFSDHHPVIEWRMKTLDQISINAQRLDRNYRRGQNNWSRAMSSHENKRRQNLRARKIDLLLTSLSSLQHKNFDNLSFN